jgi:hypothetical protein
MKKQNFKDTKFINKKYIKIFMINLEFKNWLIHSKKIENMIIMILLIITFKKKMK